MDEYVRILTAALTDLATAARKLTVETVPQTPLPRPREFVFISADGKKVSWPATEAGTKRVWWEYCRTAVAAVCRTDAAASSILLLSRYQPRPILRALRRIQAATAWCEARAEGRRRAAQEILRQQRAAAEVLEAEAAMQALK